MADNVNRRPCDSPLKVPTDTGDLHYCRFCGLPVRNGESHGTEQECIDALRFEIQRRGVSTARGNHEGAAAGRSAREPMSA